MGSSLLRELSDQLSMVNRHIFGSEHNVDQQKIRVADLERRGQDATSSRTLLATFEQSLRLHHSHRDRILREMDG
jgi:hypothetical protein